MIAKLVLKELRHKAVWLCKTEGTNLAAFDRNYGGRVTNNWWQLNTMLVIYLIIGDTNNSGYLIRTKN